MEHEKYMQGWALQTDVEELLEWMEESRTPDIMELLEDFRECNG
jgi:hypothetical protein